MSDAGGTRRRWVRPAVAGVAAVAFGVGLGELSAAILAPESGPFVVVGALLIDLAPPWAKDAAIALFGTADKAALLVGIGLAVLALAGAAGVLDWRRPPWGRVVIAGLGAVGILAAATRANAPMLAIVPTGVVAIASIAALTVLLRRVEPFASSGMHPTYAGATVSADDRARAGVAASVEHRSDGGVAASAEHRPDAGVAASADERREAPDRRMFLAWAGGAAAIGVLAALGASALSAGSRAIAALRDALALPDPVTRARVPASAELGVDGLDPVITPNVDFYRIDTALAVPQVDPAEWRLRIHGMVEREVTVTWDELLALPLEESVTTLACVSNEVGGGLIGNAVWLGYPIRELLARAAPTSDADMVLSRSVDGFTASTPLEVLQDDRDAILAVGMNGEPLPLEHGFPVRMVVPGLYGYVSATKWVVDLEVTRFDRARAYWSDRGWSERGPIKISSRIDVPRSGQPLTAGTVTVAGVAWHQHTGIEGVEVQVDDGEWRAATLATAISVDTWVQWRYDWDAEPGSHTLRVRATGLDGEVQTAEVAPVAPDGATGLHQRTVDVA